MLGYATFLVTGPDGRWHPGIGDPTFVGWLTVFAYFYAAYSAYRVRARCLALLRPYRGAATAESLALHKVASFWLFATLLLVALGINKQLDLQSWLTEIARDLSREQGWYGERRGVQRAFIAGVALSGLGLAALLASYFRPVLTRVRGGLVGIVLLLVFIVVRAASFHHVDAFLKSGAVRMNWLLELGAIGLVAFAARRALGGPAAKAEPEATRRARRERRRR